MSSSRHQTYSAAHLRVCTWSCGEGGGLRCAPLGAPGSFRRRRCRWLLLGSDSCLFDPLPTFPAVFPGTDLTTGWESPLVREASARGAPKDTMAFHAHREALCPRGPGPRPNYRVSSCFPDTPASPRVSSSLRQRGLLGSSSLYLQSCFLHRMFYSSWFSVVTKTTCSLSNSED